MRSAVEAAAPFKREPTAQVRSVLVTELSARGIDDPTAQELDFLVEAVVTSLTAAGARHGWRGLRSLLRMVSDLKKSASPGWTLSPDDMPSICTFRDDQQELSATVHPVPAARDVITRLFAELPAQGNTREGDNEPRLCDCWLSVDPGEGPTAAVSVHIGKFVIAELSDEHAQVVREVIAVHGGSRHAVKTFAEVHGDDPDTGSIQIFFPDRA